MKKLKWNRKLSILVLIMFVTVSFASFNTNLFIDGKAYVRVDKDIRITNIRLLESEYNGYENTSSEYTNRTISTDVSLPRQASSVTYEVTVSNVSDKRYKITDIIEDSYDNRNVKYELIDASIGNIVEPHTEKTFKVKFTNNVTVVEEDDVYETKTYNYDYTGDIQEFVAPFDGTYTLEVWGASGGGANNDTIGYGGYSTGKINLKENEKLYVYVGGVGGIQTIDPSASHSLILGGWNGGGSGYLSQKNGSNDFSAYKTGSGGGSTDIRKVKANVTFNNNSYYTNHRQSLESRIIVAGGGGGQGHNAKDPSAGGHAGGIAGNNVSSSWNDSHTHPAGGTQTTGTFGYGSTPVTGKTSTHLDAGQKDLYCSGGAGGGWYGGEASIYQNCRNFGGAGGSGYIGTSALFDKAMYCYNCQESNEESTKTISVDQVSENPESNKAKIGNGYAKITVTRKIEDGSAYNFDYTGGEQTFTAPYSGTYRLETWGAQGGKIIHNDTVLDGGYGGYSTGLITLVKNSKLYVNNGGQGVVALGKKERTATSYNGGGAGFNNSGERYISGGGGATHIALSSGLLSEFENNKDNILIVSGGGGGIWFYPDARGYYYTKQVGHAGGYIGNTGIGHHAQGGDYEALGGTQTAGYAFGQGQTAPASEKSGGGGGYYGGKSNTFSGGGGSGYIGNSLLTDKIMYCYTCQESQDINTRTVSTNSHSQTPKQNVAKEGDGYSRITLIKRTVNQTKLTLDFTFEEYVNGNEYTFGFTGDEQIFTIPKTGIYKLETWGAEGSTYASGTGGYGGYSTGFIKLNKNEVLYINVGGKSRDKPYGQAVIVDGGYNGGGSSGDSGGGGATHISSESGLLSQLEDKKDSIIIVAGGGGGGERTAGGSGGGYVGNTGKYGYSNAHLSGATGGTQTAGGVGSVSNTEAAEHTQHGDGDPGSFGKGADSCMSDTCGAGAGGGGYYGGGSSHYASGGGGGSGYIANNYLYDKVMYCYNCAESSDVSTKTISTENVSDTAISNYAKQSDGFAKITLIEEIPEYTFDYTGDVQEFVAPYKGIYKVELWGASGGYTTEGMTNLGAYTSGNIELEKNKKLYLYVGSEGISTVPSSSGGVSAYYNPFNGGGAARNQTNYQRYWGTGGSATDIRLENGKWSSFDSLKTRIMVAAGAGGNHKYNDINNAFLGGAGGGFIGYEGVAMNNTHGTPGTGGTQFKGGYTMCNRDQYTCPSDWNFSSGELGKGSFGQGGASPQIGSAGGGSGYFGGGSSLHVQTGGGGSSYISGHSGCASIKETSTVNSISFVNDSNGVACNDENSAGYNALGYNTDSVCNKHYSGKVFTNTVMIDGKGYAWDENGKGDSVVGMPSHDGRTTMTGNTGNGYAKIILIEKIDTYNITYDLDGGTLKNKKKTYSTFDDDITLGTPTKKGYKFDGWTGGKNLVKESGNIWYDGPSKKFYSGNSKAHSIIIEVKPNTTYTISKKYAGNRFVVALSSEPIANQVSYSRIFVKNDENLTQYTFTTGENERYLMFGYHREDDENGDLETALAEIQIEEGNVATAYEEPILTPTMDISIPKGSVGNRTYTANWKEYVSVTIIYDACIEDRDNNRRYLDYIDTVDFIEYEYLPSLTTQEYLARNSDYYMYIGDVWGITNRLTILNELFEAGANIVTTGNDTTAQRVPFGVTDYHSTEDETITKKVSNEFTSQFKDSYSTGTDSKHFFTTSNTEVWYSVTVDDIEYDYMGRYTGTKGNKWIWSSGVFFPEYAMFPAVLRYDKYGN